MAAAVSRPFPVPRTAPANAFNPLDRNLFRFLSGLLGLPEYRRDFLNSRVSPPVPERG